MIALPKNMSEVISIVRSCGFLAVALQGQVGNIGKAEARRGGDSERLADMRQAKTKIDEIVQDILVARISELYNGMPAVDAEEVTPFFRNYFVKDVEEVRFVIDPIDGTLEYLEGSDGFSICVGAFRGTFLEYAVVYFPARDTLYFVSSGEAYFGSGGLSPAGFEFSCLNSPAPGAKLIYFNRRVPTDMVCKLTNLGYILLDDEHEGIGAPDCLLACLDGSALCYLSEGRQIRDILLGPIVSCVDGGVALDWQGDNIVWPNKKRLAQGIFASQPIPEDVLSTIAEFSSVGGDI